MLIKIKFCNEYCRELPGLISEKMEELDILQIDLAKFLKKKPQKEVVRYVVTLNVKYIANKSSLGGDWHWIGFC